MWLKPTRPPTDHRTNYAQALAAPPSPRHVQWLRERGYTGPILSQRHASELVTRLAAQIEGKEASRVTS